MTHRLALFLALATCSVAAVAQDSHAWKPNSHSFTGQFGVGWFGLINGIDVTYEEEDGREYDVNFDGGPATTFAYDYRVGRTFSIGAAYGTQAIELTDFRTTDGGEQIEGEARLARHFASARALFHYGRARNVEFYSGARAGFTLWRVTTTGGVDDDQVVVLNSEGGSFVLPHLTIIPIGFKGYLGDAFFLGAETMFGSPHVIAAQLGLRF